MAGLFGTTKNSSTVPTYTNIPLQTSALGLCIPIGWGRFRLGTNLIDYVDFKSHKQKAKGKGGAGGKGNGQKTYTATLAMALCEGPIYGIASVWNNQSLTTLAQLGLALFPGTLVQAPWSYMTSHHPDHALAYSSTAYVVAINYDLGSGATIPQHNFEVLGTLWGSTPAPGGDANPADIISDFLTNPQYSIGLPTATLDAASLAHYRTYCTAQSLWLSPLLNRQEQVTTILQRWAQITNTWIFWSGNVLKFVPLGDSNIVANGATYQPNCQPIYDLTYDDLIVDGANADPIQVTRSDPADGYNRVRLHVRDRLNYYNSTPVDWMDQSSVDLYGQLQAQEIQAEEICDTAIAAIVAQLIGLRATYVRNTYAFKLGYGFVLLEPGDVVTLTDPNIGLSRAFVRIQTIEEDDKGLLAVVAEEFPFDCTSGAGVFGQSIALQQGSNQSVLTNAGLADPGNVNQPMIVEPSGLLTNGVPQVWIGLSGGANWGGANAYISFDNVTFSEIGTIAEPSIQGVLTAPLPATADPDTTDTLAIDLTQSDSVLPSTATHADADADRTLCLVNDEFLAYGTVTPGTSAYAFNLTYLRRGAFGTTVASHALGAEFTRIDLAAILEYTLPQAYVGRVLYFKFTSFNLFGNQTQDLSAVTTYTYTPIGVAYMIAPPTSPTLSVTTPAVASAISLTLVWTASAGPLLGSYEVQFSADGGTTWTTDASVGASALSYTLTPAVANANYQARARAISQNGLAVSTWATSSVVNAGPLPSGGTSKLPMVNGDNPVGIIADPSGVPVYVVQ